MHGDPGLAAAILAGGRARRFDGVNKSALAIGGRTIADRQFAALGAVTTTVFVVGGPAQGWPAGVRVVPDAVAGGALGGIYTAIVESPCDRVLVVGCDMPFLTPAFLQHLAAVRDADIVIPRTDRGLEPLCAIYSKACAQGVRERLDRGELRAAVRLDGVRRVEIGPDIIKAYDPDGLLLANINTPHDYARIVSLKDTDCRLPTED